MDKKNAKKILERLLYWKQEDDKHQESLSAYIDAVAPSSYAPMIEVSFADSFIAGVNIGIDGITEDLEYFIYDAQNMENPYVIYQDKRYNAKDIDEYAEYLGEHIKTKISHE